MDEEGEAVRWVCTDLKSEDSEDVQKVLELSEAVKCSVCFPLCVCSCRLASRRGLQIRDPCPAVPLP